MERFELSETEEERTERYERFKEEMGWENWQIEAYEKLFGRKSKFNHSFGLENTFPTLSSEKQKEVDKLFDEREELLEAYNELSEVLNPLLDKECEMWENIKTISKRICELEGHRLSEKMKEEMEPDGYGTWMTLGYSRTCLICGSKFTTAKENDVVVKGEIDNLERVKIKVKK